MFEAKEKEYVYGNWQCTICQHLNIVPKKFCGMCGMKIISHKHKEKPFNNNYHGKSISQPSFIQHIFYESFVDSKINHSIENSKNTVPTSIAIDIVSIEPQIDHKSEEDEKDDEKKSQLPSPKANYSFISPKSNNYSNNSLSSSDDQPPNITFSINVNPYQQWHCTQCTFLNEWNANHCKICAHRKYIKSGNKISLAQSKSTFAYDSRFMYAGNEWACSRCRYLNQTSNICQVCGTSSTQQWQCLICSQLNMSQHFRCHSCGFESKGKPLPDLSLFTSNVNKNKKEIEYKNNWRCIQCWFLNNNASKYCAVCYHRSVNYTNIQIFEQTFCILG